MKLFEQIKKRLWFGGASKDSGENFAAKYLKRKGYKIICRNFDVKFAEIDIIAKKGKIIAFVEVKQRKTTLFGLPREAVGIDKQKKIRKAASLFMVKFKPNLQPRFDVIEVYGVCDGKEKPRIEHIKNAF